MPALYSKINELVNASIERDVNKWQYYGVLLPYIHSPQSPPGEQEIVDQISIFWKHYRKKMAYGATWTWFDNMESYGKEFIISENWWKIHHRHQLCFPEKF